MVIKKMKVGTFNLKKYLFLFLKGHMNNGLTIEQAEGILLDEMCEVEEIFDLRKSDEMVGKFNAKEKYPYIFDKNGEQIGGKVEDYDC